MALREEHILECRAIALRINTKIKEVESSAYHTAIEEGPEELLDSLKQIKKAMDCNISIDHLEGINANRLVTEQGLVSKWLSLAKQYCLVSKGILPYHSNPLESMCNTISADGHVIIYYNDSEKKHIDQWIKRVNEKIASLSKKSEEDTIPAQYRTAPTSKKRLVEEWGGDMTITKLRSMIKNRRIRCIVHTRQSCTFDKRDLPSNVSKALEE